MPDLTCKNIDLWNALVASEGQPPLVKLASLDLPAKASYAIKKALRKATDEFKDLDAARTALVEKYAKKDADGKAVPTEDGRGVQLTDPEAFTRDFQELLAQDVTLQGVWTVTYVELGDAKVSARDLELLDAFVKEPE